MSAVDGTPGTPALARGLRIFLYLTAAITGAAVMIIEILGAKMLAPFLGTSHHVWTAQITVTLVALACGYYLGGWLVDRWPKLHLLYGCLAGAAGYVCLAVWICEPVARACKGMSLDAGTALASAILFFVPLTLLAAASPFLVRVLTQSVSGLGSLVGRLSALNTIGSIVGAIAVSYLVLPALPNGATMVTTALLLAALSLTYVVLWGLRSRPSVRSQDAGWHFTLPPHSAAVAHQNRPEL